MLHRRIFLKILGATTAALSGTRAEQTFAATAEPAAVDHIHMAPSAAVTMGSVQKAYSFLTAPEIRFIEAATALLIPADELGGGAREAEVSIFIDWQLAGSFGANAWTYRQGPWTSETGTQGYQLPLSYRDLYRIGIAATDQYCQKTYGKVFADLPTNQQTDVLKGLETVASDVKLQDVPGVVFFKVLLQNTKEGFFADPVYGGNRDKIGWKLVGFPGVAGSYTDLVEKYNEPYQVEPVGLREMQMGAVDVDPHGHPVHKFADRTEIRKMINSVMGPGKERSGALPWDGTLPPSEVV